MRRKHYVFRYRVTKNGYSLLRRGRVIFRARDYRDMENFCIGFCGDEAGYTLRIQL